MLNLSPIVDTWMVPAIALVLTGLGAWLVAKSGTWLDAHAKFLNASAREKITNLENQAVAEGVNVVTAYVQREGARIHPVVSSPVLAWGAQIAINHASGVLNDNGASPGEIAAKILAKLPAAVVTADTTGATPIAYNPPVTVEPLPLTLSHSADPFFSSGPKMAGK